MDRLLRDTQTNAKGYYSFSNLPTCERCYVALEGVSAPGGRPPRPSANASALSGGTTPDDRFPESSEDFFRLRGSRLVEAEDLVAGQTKKRLVLTGVVKIAKGQTSPASGLDVHSWRSTTGPTSARSRSTSAW